MEQEISTEKSATIQEHSRIARCCRCSKDLCTLGKVHLLLEIVDVRCLVGRKKKVSKWAFQLPRRRRCKMIVVIQTDCANMKAGTSISMNRSKCTRYLGRASVNMRKYSGLTGLERSRNLCSTASKFAFRWSQLSKHAKRDGCFALHTISNAWLMNP